MGIVRLEETQKAELEEFRRMMLSCAAVHRRKDDDGLKDRVKVLAGASDDDVLDKLVCVTSGVSYLGIAIVNQLLVDGYSVRIIVDNEENVEKLREMEISGEMRLTNSVVEVVMAKLTDVESLTEAFAGCCGVFHTAGFVDPAGLSGYTKVMCNIEVNACKNVIKACGISPSVRHCVLTSSLLTCIWKDNSGESFNRIDHNCWSDDSVCLNNKLWYALGKLRAEKAAWELAKENNLKLATICTGLITGPKFYHRNPTPTLAYLKGIQEMYTKGLLATVNVNSLAKAHVRVFQEMKKAGACGRFICFDQILDNIDGIEKLAQETGLNMSSITSGASCSNGARFELSNGRLVNLMSRTRRCDDE